MARRNVKIQKSVYSMATADGNSAEIVMYGDICEQQPFDWNGNPTDGQFILLTEFLNDLEQVANCKHITIRMNSYGGDAGVSNTIHNRLREIARSGAKLTCIVDGVAMSGGSLIMCACDTVKANPSSLIMIHKCWTFLFGGYNADEMRQAAEQNDVFDKMQVEIYKRKTGLTDDELLAMMGETTYMTGREAKEKGFVDEILEDSEQTNIHASADGRSLFVMGKQVQLSPGQFAPDWIPTVTPAASTAVKTNTTEEGAKKAMASTVAELRKENPDLVAQIEAEAKTSVQTTAENERRRIQEIDEIAAQFDAEIVAEAKYGKHACTAQEMAFRAAQKAAEQGRQFLGAMKQDAEKSGTSGVGAAYVPEDKESTCTLEQARADAKAFNESRKGVR